MKPMGKLTPASIALPEELQLRLAADVERIPRITKSEWVRDMLIFTYRMIDRFGLEPKDISDNCHISDKGLIQRPPVTFSHAYGLFKKLNNYDDATALYRLSMWGLRGVKLLDYRDFDEGRLDEEIEMEKRA